MKYYTAAPVNFILHKTRAWARKRYFEYMSAGRGAVDYGIVSPAHMSTFSRAAPSWTRPSCSPACRMECGADQDLSRRWRPRLHRADRLCQGRRANIRQQAHHRHGGIARLKVRVQGAPIWSRTSGGRDVAVMIAITRSTTASRTTSSRRARTRLRVSGRALLRSRAGS